MKRVLSSLLILLAAFALMGSDCNNDIVTPPDDPVTTLSQIEVTMGGEVIQFCCSPGDLPTIVNTITIRNNTTAEEPIWFAFEDNEMLSADPANGTVAVGETVTITISATTCGFENVAAVMHYGYDPIEYPPADYPALQGHKTDTINNTCYTINQLIEWFCPDDPYCQTLIGLAAVFNPVGVEVLHSAIMMAAVIPFLSYTEIQLHGGIMMNFGLAILQQLWGTREDFPCGPGPNGYTVCPNIPQVPGEGDYFIVWNTTTGDIPLEDTEHTYQFGFVFDADLNTVNNYQGAGDYANDFYDDTDRWYSVEYTPAGGWELKVVDARTGMGLAEIASAARVIIRDGTMLLAVPVSEFDNPTPRFRVTAFAHMGDWGMGDPPYWSGDLHPTVAEGLDTLTVGTD